MPTPTSFAELVNGLIGIINIIIPTFFGLLFVYVIWKIVDAWILNAGNEQKREEGKQLVTVAVLIFVLMVSAWGVVALIQQSLFG